MKKDVLQFLCSPCCREDLYVSVCFASKGNDANIENGILQCKKCERQYPVIDGIPRLLMQLNKEEADELKNFLNGIVTMANEPIGLLNEEERYRRLEAIVTKKVVDGYADVWHMETRDKMKQTKDEIDYRTRTCEQQIKTSKTITQHCTKEFKTILDIGGGQGGLTKFLYDFYKPQHIFLVDYDLEWVEVAKLRSPDAQIIRADAANLPFKEASIDLVVTQSALEHIKEYRKVVESICTTAKTAVYMTWGPNKFSVYDKGHLNAPVNLFPKSIAKYVAYAWHALIRSKVTQEAIDRGLADTFYISTTEVKKILQRYGTAKNVFVDFAMNSLKYGYFFESAKIKDILKKYPRLSKILFAILVFCRIEPDCYYMLIKR